MALTVWAGLTEFPIPSPVGATNGYTIQVLNGQYILGPASSATIGGSIAATQVAFGSGADTIAGDSTFTFNSTTKALGVQQIIATGAGAASTPPSYFTGALYTAGNGTTTFPHIFHQPTGTTAGTTWSNGANNGTVFGANEASGFTGNFADFRIAGARAASIDSTGNYNLYGSGFGTMSFGLYGSAAFIGFRDTNMLFISGNGLGLYQGTNFTTTGNLSADNSAKLGFAPNWFTGGDTYFTRISAGIFQAGTASVPQAIRMGDARFGYDASNYFDTTVSSAGAVTFDATGASAGFAFADNVTLNPISYSGYINSNSLKFTSWQNGTPLTMSITHQPFSNRSYLNVVGLDGSTTLMSIKNDGTVQINTELDIGPQAGGASGTLQIIYGTPNYLVSSNYARDIAIQGNGAVYGFYYKSSNNYVGINANSPSARCHIIDTSETLRQGYDTSNYFSTIVGSTGGVTLDAVGSGAAFSFLDDVKVGTIGKTYYVKTGSNAAAGTATLVGGTVTVSTTAVTANSAITLSTGRGTITNLGIYYESARTAGTSFTITSLNILDTSSFDWILVEKA